MAELESAAPPVELERPSKPPTEEAAFTIASSGSAPPDSAPPGSAPSETAPVESDLSAPAPSGAALPDPGRAGPQQSTELPPAQVRVPLPSRGTPPAVSSANAEAQPPSATTPPHASSQPMPDTSASSSSVDISASAGAAAEQRRQSLGVTTEARGSEALAYGSTAVAVRLSGDSPTRESPANTVSPLAGIVSPQTKHVSPRADGDLPGRENGAQAPELEKGLDAIIEELALEVRQVCFC